MLAMAEPIAVSVGLDERFSDNVRQSNTGEESDLESRVNLNVSYNSDPGYCNGSIAGKFGYGRWLDKTYDPETYVNSDIFGDCQLFDNLYWDISNRTRDIVQDSRGGDNPDNTSRKNIFSTGPRYIMRLSARDQLSFDLRYETTDYDEPDETDSERYVGSAAWNHLLSSTLSGGLSVQVDQAEMDTGQEVDRETLNLNFNKQWVATVVSGSVGLSNIENTFAGSTTENDGLVWNLFFERELNSSSSVYLNGSHELTDQTSDYDFVFSGLVFNVQETEAIEVTAVRAGYRNALSNGDTFQLGVFFNLTDYLDSGDDETSSGFEASYNRKLTSHLRGDLLGSFDQNSYSDDDTDDQTVTVAAGLQYDVSRAMTAQMRVGREDRSSDVASREYVEHWILLGLKYRFR
ncbi:outer membrane beta-barrel protein [Marinobacter mobilis]|uniref:Uncharacterized protein, PEP-CTERM system associated n=1 Tax=Marinobacter mobilis TaxID=488533 RepID=A0A1H2UUH6_9GAMM|nr:outer membrane beta-barrel protein [Marinobacter mobilis]SDW59741.1 uncharacterized protein, PEP-CTERM system associated [Marinobacter mobilis]